jgi:hypothetical protein
MVQKEFILASLSTSINYSLKSCIEEVKVLGNHGLAAVHTIGTILFHATNAVVRNLEAPTMFELFGVI